MHNRTTATAGVIMAIAAGALTGCSSDSITTDGGDTTCLNYLNMTEANKETVLKDYARQDNEVLRDEDVEIAISSFDIICGFGDTSLTLRESVESVG